MKLRSTHQAVVEVPAPESLLVYHHSPQTVEQKVGTYVVRAEAAIPQAAAAAIRAFATEILKSLERPE